MQKTCDRDKVLLGSPREPAEGARIANTLSSALRSLSCAASSAFRVLRWETERLSAAMASSIAIEESSTFFAFVELSRRPPWGSSGAASSAEVRGLEPGCRLSVLAPLPILAEVAHRCICPSRYCNKIWSPSAQQ